METISYRFCQDFFDEASKDFFIFGNSFLLMDDKK